MSQDPFDNLPALSPNDRAIVSKYIETCGSFIIHNNTSNANVYRILINAYRECLDTPLPSTISQEGKKTIYKAFFMAAVNVKFAYLQKKRRANNTQRRNSRNYKRVMTKKRNRN
jgi:hypothetical protein